MSKLKLFKNTIEASIRENMSMTSTQGKAIFNMYRPRTKKSENN